VSPVIEGVENAEGPLPGIEQDQRSARSEARAEVFQSARRVGHELESTDAQNPVEDRPQTELFEVLDSDRESARGTEAGHRPGEIDAEGVGAAGPQPLESRAVSAPCVENGGARVDIDELLHGGLLARSHPAQRPGPAKARVPGGGTAEMAGDGRVNPHISPGFVGRAARRRAQWGLRPEGRGRVLDGTWSTPRRANTAGCGASLAAAESW
jgi:hypothetical protein